MGAFEDFVNAELPKRIGTIEDGGGTGNLSAGKFLQTTGVGLLVETVDAPSGGGGSPFVNSVDVTYAELKNLVETNAVNPGTYYKITDYQTVNIAGDGVINTAPVEPLIVQGVTTNSITRKAYSDVHSLDVIEYSMDLDVIVSNVSAEYEDMTSTGGNIICSNFTANSFDVNIEPIIDDQFYVYAEDDNGGEIEYDEDGLDEDFTITNLGNGHWRITDLTGDIQFNNPDYAYLEVSYNGKLVDRPGYITYREEPEKKIKCLFDFRGCKYQRYKIDLTNIPAWDSSATYNYQQKVIYNNSLYISICPNNHNNNPQSSSKNWCLQLIEVDQQYYITKGYNSVGLSNVESTGNGALIPVFSIINGANFDFTLDNVKNVVINSEDTIFIKNSEYNTIDNVYIGEESKKNTFYGQVRSCSFFLAEGIVCSKQNSLRNIQVSGSCRNVNFVRYLNGAEIGKLHRSVICQGGDLVISQLGYSALSILTKSKIGFNNRYLYLNGENLSFGNNNHDIYVANGFYMSFRHSNYRIEIFCNSCSNNQFLDLNRYFRFTGSVLFGSKFGTNNGRSGTWMQWKGAVRGVTVGNDCFYLEINDYNTTVQNTVFEGNNRAINATGLIYDCHFGIGAGNINCRNLIRTTVGNGTSQINMSNHILDCYFAPGLNWFQYHGNGAGNFLKNKVYATHIDFTENATHVKGNYGCTIDERPDGTARLTYIDNNDVLQVVDVTS